MSGLADYAAQNTLNYLIGLKNMPGATAAASVPPNGFLALFTTAPTADAGTGGTEVSGGAYARPQIAGVVATNGTTTGGSSATLNFAAVPAWVTVGMTAWDLTTPTAITSAQTVLSKTGTTVVLTANVNVTVASADNRGIYDAVTSGNLLFWDWLGNNKWIPFSCTLASPGVLSTDLVADVPVNGTPCVVTAKYGGTLPTTAGSWAGALTSAGSSTNTFNLGVNTTAIGGGLFRQITQQSIPANVTASFAAAQFTLSLA
jgi:hypothetical protein